MRRTAMTIALVVAALLTGAGGVALMDLRHRGCQIHAVDDLVLLVALIALRGLILLAAVGHARRTPALERAASWVLWAVALPMALLGMSAVAAVAIRHEMPFWAVALGTICGMIFVWRYGARPAAAPSFVAIPIEATPAVAAAIRSLKSPEPTPTDTRFIVAFWLAYAGVMVYAFTPVQVVFPPDAKWSEGRVMAGTLRQALDVVRARGGGTITGLSNGTPLTLAAPLKLRLADFMLLEHFNGWDFAIAIGPNGRSYTITACSS